MNDLTAIYRAILAHTDDIVRLWDEQVKGAPWLRLPREARIDHIPEMLEAIVDVLLAHPDVRTSRERALRTGIRHGTHRKRHGFDDGVLHLEHYLLRSAAWTVIKQLDSNADRCFDAIARFDVVLTHTTTASLHGYHLGEGDLPLSEDEVVERLASAKQPWPPPPRA